VNPKTNLKISSLPLFVLVLALAGCAGPRVANPAAYARSEGLKPSPAGYNIPEALISLNKLFLSGYTNRLEMVKSNTSPVIVAGFASLVLYRNGTVETNRVVPDIYHALKTIAHMPFGIFLRLDPFADETSLPAPVIDDLNIYPAKIADAEKALPEAGFTEEQLDRQRKILREAGAFVEQVLSDGKISKKGLWAFARRLGPLQLANVEEAAIAQLDMLHAVVTDWKTRMTPEEWKKLVVVIRGVQTPRRYNIYTVYFAKILNDPPHHLGYPLESKRLIYAESFIGTRGPLDLMATTFIDGDASEAFFGDRWRMSRDVLADGAQRHLKRLKFEK
jgi:hypothetical protein